MIQAISVSLSKVKAPSPTAVIAVCTLLATMWFYGPSNQLVLCSAILGNVCTIRAFKHGGDCNPLTWFCLFTVCAANAFTSWRAGNSDPIMPTLLAAGDLFVAFYTFFFREERITWGLAEKCLSAILVTTMVTWLLIGAKVAVAVELTLLSVASSKLWWDTWSEPFKADVWTWCCFLLMAIAAWKIAPANTVQHIGLPILATVGNIIMIATILGRRKWLLGNA